MYKIPNILTKIPGPKSNALYQERLRVITPGVYLIQPIAIDSGHGAVVNDIDGNTLLDFTSGIGVTSLGHVRREIVETICKQASKLIHGCIHVANYESYINLAKRLIDISPIPHPKRAMFLNSGSEAVENAIKIIRQSTGRANIISFENSFHGRTYMALTLTGKFAPYKTGLGPFMPGVFYTPFPYAYRCPWGTKIKEECGKAALDHLEKHVLGSQVDPKTVGAVVTEIVQGEGGFIDPPNNFLPSLKELCEKYCINLLIDEVQTGFGRTGKMWAIEHFDVQPDIMVIAKAIASGLPLSAVVGSEELMGNIEPGSLGGTFGGNPIACMTAMKVLDIIEKNNVIEKSATLGIKIKKRLNELKEEFIEIGDVRGLGPMLAMEFIKDEKSKKPNQNATNKIIKIALSKGLILLKAGLYDNCIRLHPPLTIEDEYLDIGLNILEESIKVVV